MAGLSFKEVSYPFYASSKSGWPSKGMVRERVGLQIKRSLGEAQNVPRNQSNQSKSFILNKRVWTAWIFEMAKQSTSIFRSMKKHSWSPCEVHTINKHLLSDDKPEKQKKIIKKKKWLSFSIRKGNLPRTGSYHGIYIRRNHQYCPSTSFFLKLRIE